MNEETNITKIGYVSDLLTKVQRIEQTIKAIPTIADETENYDDINFGIDSVYTAVVKLEKQLENDISILQGKATDIMNEAKVDYMDQNQLRRVNKNG